MKIKIKIILIIVAIMVGVTIYTKPVDIDKTYEGCIYLPCEEFKKETTIKLKGILYRYVFHENFFEGSLEVDGIQYKINTPIKKTLGKSCGLHYIGFAIEFINQGEFFKHVGTILISKDFKLIWGTLDKLESAYGEGCSFAGPCKNGKEANDIANKIRR